MNRREALTAGLGVGGVLMASSVLACPPKATDANPAASDSKAKEGKEGKPGVTSSTYCPVYPYMFCGTYTVYYALQSPACGSPASLAGPNGLVMGCGGTPNDCQEVKDARDNPFITISEKPHGVHERLHNVGRFRRASPVTVAPGVTINGDLQGFAVRTERPERFYRLFRVIIQGATIDKEFLPNGVNANSIVDAHFFIGHEILNPEIENLPLATETNVGGSGGHTAIVRVTINEEALEFLAVKMRGR